jgi:hypothetical protein|tara:strand:+ start:52 stop:258 length:207 start_codon:yes stop_codon:yes gene_type:complete
MRNDFSWNLYFQYKGKQMELKYVNSEMRKGNDGSGINYDIWIPDSYEEWFSKIIFPKEGQTKWQKNTQ